MEKVDVVEMIFDQMSIDNPPRNRKLRHYPSSLPYYENGIPQGKCKRQLFYAMSGIEESHAIDPVALFKMDIGNIIHDKIDDVLNRALARVYGDDFNTSDEKLMAYIQKVNLEITGRNQSVILDATEKLGHEPTGEELKELKFEDLVDPNGGEIPIIWNVDGLDLPLSGRLDKIININGKRGMGEWKSTYGYGANYIKKDGPKLEALLQCRSYLENPELELDFIILIYIARDSGYMFGYYIELGDNKDDMTLYHMNSGKAEVRQVVFSEIVRACKEVEIAVAEETIPERDYHVNVNPKTNTLVQKGGDWQCRYCNFRGICYGVDN